jgi:uncharacterized repeat protein (TIGR04138 family)
MTGEVLLNKIQAITRKDKRYDQEAYTFIYEALDHARKQLAEPRHMSGHELLESIKTVAIYKFGPFTKLVLNTWGIHKTEDWGNVVFNMVNNDLLSKTDQDVIEDFQNGYDFDAVFSFEKTVDLSKMNVKKEEN